MENLELVSIDLLNIVHFSPVLASFQIHENITTLTLKSCKLRDREFSLICKELSRLKKLTSVNFS